jgi:hypothetical protein
MSVTKGVVNRPVTRAPLHKDCRVWDRKTDLTPAARRKTLRCPLCMKQSETGRCEGEDREREQERERENPLTCKQRSSKAYSAFAAMI